MGPKKSKSKSKSDSPKSKKGSPKSEKGSKKSGDSRGKRWPDNEEDETEFEVVMPAPKGIMLHRMRFTLQGEVESDIEFIVGSDSYASTIRANKCVLQSRSPVFEDIIHRCEEWKTSETGNLTEIRSEFLKQVEKIEYQELGQTGSKKGSPDKKKGSPDKSKGSKKGSPNKKKGSPDKSKSSKKGSPDKSKGSKKGSPDKKKGSPDKSKGSKKGSPDKSKGKGSSNKEEEEEDFEVDKIFEEDAIYGWDQVRIRDVTAEGMYKLLRYIYYDELEFTGVIAAMRTLQAARKYKFPRLRKACITYLENNICIEHVLKLIQLAFELKEERMQLLCLQWIINETYEVLGRQEFVDISHVLLDFILKQDILNIRELELFQRVQHWAAHQCRNNNLTATTFNEKAMLGPETLKLIRFPALLPHEFATIAIDSGYLKQDEILTILTYYITCRMPQVPYSIHPRRRPCLDLNLMETDSITFSDQTDLTFLGYKIRRCHSFKDLTVPVCVLPPIPDVTLIPRLTRQTSLPGDLEVTLDLRDKIIDNMNLLKEMDMENRHYEFAKDHLVLLRKHYR